MIERFNNWWEQCGIWSACAFGNGYKAKSVLRHIEKEVQEAREEADKDGTASLEEWCDIAQLAMDGARRAGYTADEFLDELERKLEVNGNRQWVEGEDGVCEHVRD